MQQTETLLKLCRIKFSIRKPKAVWCCQRQEITTPHSLLHFLSTVHFCSGNMLRHSRLPPSFSSLHTTFLKPITTYCGQSCITSLLDAVRKVVITCRALGLISLNAYTAYLASIILTIIIARPRV